VDYRSGEEDEVTKGIFGMLLMVCQGYSRMDQSEVSICGPESYSADISKRRCIGLIE
jgi:hypothetical protein